jgi:hypothetical protein
MKQKIIKHLIISTTVLAIMYLFAAFVLWDILWIREITSYRPITRFIISMIFLFVNIYTHIFVFEPFTIKK